jgi:phosphoribosylanthranilate isomerase
MGLMSRLRIKICGITQAADGQTAARLGADAIGINFYPRSPRYVPPAQAPAILRELPPLVDVVGLFVEQPLRQCFALGYQLGIRTIQWYGASKEVADAFPFHYLPTFGVRESSDLEAIGRFLQQCRQAGQLPAGIVVDAHVPGQWGGTGQPVPWQLLADFQPGVPLVLAGGLTPENVALAVRQVGPYAVDVASGVESRPGHKDPEKIKRFIDQAREAASR